MAAQLDLSAGQGASLEVGSEHKSTNRTQQPQKAQMQKLDGARPSASSRKGIVLSSNYKEPA